MPAPAFLPVLLKPCVTSLRLCWRALRAALLVFVGLLAVAWMVLHWAILPRADELRPWLEREARQALGVELRIGSITAQSGGWMPGLELADVRLLDPAGREALRLPRVAAVLSAQSFLVLEPRFSQLLIDAPEVEIRRDRNGRLFVAGLDVEGADKAEASGTADAWLDWLFSQPELAVLKGRVRWVDERRAQPAPLELDEVNLVLRNGLRRHQLRLDATPPPAWGQRFSLRGRFNQALLKRPSEFAHWKGQLYAELPRTDLRELRRHVDLPFELSEGDGSLRAWVDIQAGQPVSATLDLGLRAVRLRLLDGAPELALEQVEGRLELARSADRLSLQARRLGFVSGDGVAWPRSDWGLSLKLAPGASPAQVLGGEVNAQRLDFALMSQIAQRLPLGEAAHRLLASLQPRGVLADLRGEWQGPSEAPTHYRVQARLDGLALAAEGQPEPLALGRPGLRGASLAIDANERGGQAQLSVKDGEVELPGLFEEAVLPIQTLQTRMSWKLPAPGDKKPEFELRLTDLQLQTPDTQGELDVLWHRAAGASGPGAIDLTAKLSGLAATRVARYMPQSLPVTRSYLARALLAGEARGVAVRLKGELAEFPFNTPGSSGIFRVATQAHGVQLAYVPPPAEGGASAWPPFEAIDGELVFERAGMQIRGARARMLGYEVQGVNGGIADFGHKPVLDLEGTGRGQIGDLLRFVKASPLDDWLSHGLSQAQASGPAALKLAINIPLEDVESTKLKGQIQLDGIELKLRPDVPLLSSARARIDFDQRSVQVGNGSARALGGEAVIDGGTQPGDSLRFGVQGQVTAEALRRAQELGPLAQIAQAMSGQAAYRFQLAIAGGQSEVSLASSLQGLTLDLPAPLHKEADAALPLRWLQVPTAAHREEIRVELGTSAAPLLQAQLQRDTASAQVLRGAIAVQDRLPALPAAGVALQANVAAIDLDAWQARLKQLGGAAAGGGDNAVGEGASQGWLPDQVNVKAQQLRLDGRQLSKVNAAISRNAAASLWRFVLDAEQLAGSIELRDVKGNEVGEVQARLARLSLPPQEAESVSERASELLDRPDARVPALDIVVEDFELRGKRLGRLEVLAQSPEHSRDWRLDKLVIQSPDATLSAHGSWATTSVLARRRRRTELDCRLEIKDAGKLLERLGQGQVLRSGKGVLEGHIAWDGSPLAFNYPSLGGQLNLKLDSGAFLKADPGVGRLLGVLSLQSLPRRLLLDFRDVFAEGFTFDGVSGDVKIASGNAASDNIRIRGVQAAVLVEGRADLAAETQDLRVVVVPEVNAGGASLAYAAVNPAIALGTFLAQLILSRPMASANTREFHITGSWSDPKVEKVERAEPAKPASAPAAASAP